MSRIAALNDEEPTQLSTGEIQPVITREAQEDAAYQQYTEALRLQAAGDDDGADVLFRAVLASPALADTAEPDTSGMARLLRYTCHKNLGSGALRRGQHEAALAGLLTAAAIDDSDVTLWYKVGVAAYRCGRYHQARSAFKQGLACSPGHWPCMDSLVSVLYLLNDFEECVLRLSAAFRRDPQYTRGRALVDLMLKEQPSLRDTMRPFLPDGDSTLSGREYDPAAGERLTKETVTLRTQRREQQRRPRPLASLSLSRPPAAASWEEVGRSLLHLYKHVTDGGAALVSA
ncbi:Calcineurin-binding protein cabin-1 [Amphibalanus amphitrite]|uniref:Calcineurin-binding protein cabin-1 n=1 Tax=Amphibalanus amphitrite TaxID=1232801 RepID=A0A6A4WAI5_AMPAM|nr:Calcineurin-binding protein cabin-1 [Amphibalanus amphitrite]